VKERIVAVGLLTQRNLDRLGSSLQHVWPVDDTPCFAGLLEAIDEADREHCRERETERQTQDPQQLFEP
jgi:hypothetical protein